MKLTTVPSLRRGIHRRWVKYGAAVACAGVVLGLTTGSSGASPSSPNSLLPANIRQSGKITIGSELDFPAIRVL